jgi:hypothetical protein
MTRCPCCGQALPERKRRNLQPQVPMSLWNPNGPTVSLRNASVVISRGEETTR